MTTGALGSAASRVANLRQRDVVGFFIMKGGRNSSLGMHGQTDLVEMRTMNCTARICFVDKSREPSVQSCSVRELIG